MQKISFINLLFFEKDTLYCGCGRSYQSLKSLKFHKKGYCPQKLNTQLFEDNIDESISSKSSLPALCRRCMESFSSRIDLYRHIKNVHWLTCPICSRIFFDQKSYDNHYFSHNHQSFTCLKCKKNFSKKKYLKRHMDRHNRPYLCNQCNKRFGSKDLLKTHQRIHSGLKPYRCKFMWCKKKFSDRSARRRHVLRHQDINPNTTTNTPNIPNTPNTPNTKNTNTTDATSCLICDDKFDNLIEYNRHIKHKHQILIF